jgi:amino acid transporter
MFFVPSALAVSKLGAVYPDEGGIYAWTRREFGDWHGFLCGWCYWLNNLFYLPGLVLSGVAMAGSALGLPENGAIVVALSLAILWLAMIANFVGLRVGKWLGNAGGIATYLGGGLLIAFGAMAWWRQGPATSLQVVPDWNWDRLNFWSQIAFAFGGLELGAVMGGEIRNAGRTVPRAAWIAGIACAAFYILGTLALLVLRTPERISPMTGLVDIGRDAAARLGQPWLAPALAVAILIGVSGQLGAWIGGVARIPFVIGVDQHLPAAFAKLHPRFGTPYVAVLSQGVACTLFVLAMQTGESLRGAYQLLVDLAVITYFIPFLYLFGASWRQGVRWGAASGLLVTMAGILLSLVPPPEVASAWRFGLKVLGGCALLIAAGRFCFQKDWTSYHVASD